MALIDATRRISSAVSTLQDEVARAIKSGAAQERGEITDLAKDGKRVRETLRGLWAVTQSTPAVDIHRSLASQLDAFNSHMFDAVANVGVSPSATIEALKSAGTAVENAEKSARKLANVAPLI